MYRSCFLTASFLFIHMNFLKYEKPVIIVGNKCDLDMERQVKIEQGQQVSTHYCGTSVSGHPSSPYNGHLVIEF